MQVRELSSLTDIRTDCISVLFETDISEYLEFIDKSYKDKGGLEEQREPLKTSSAIRIRKRMIEDIKKGTVLPPIVIGLIVEDDAFDQIPNLDPNEFSGVLADLETPDITIIDGMQRTTALIEAINEIKTIPQPIVRVEFWITKQINSLIYRMLVLNTGQVPWNLRRQIEVIFRSMIKEMQRAIPSVEIYLKDDGKRRSQPAQYHANKLIELYLVFGGRKEKVDTKERLADEFTRLDFIEATENREFTTIFYSLIEFMGKIDVQFSRATDKNSKEKFSTGQDIFKSQPAKVGFIAASAKKILGRPGLNKSHNEISDAWTKLESGLSSFEMTLSNYNSDQMNDFLRLRVLNERISIQSARIGDFERNFFTKAFDVLIDENFNIPSMELCWRAY